MRALGLALAATALLCGCGDDKVTLDGRLRDRPPSTDLPRADARLPGPDLKADKPAIVDARPPDSRPREAMPPDAPPGPTKLKGTLHTYNPFPKSDPVAAADVCLYQNGAKTSQCTTTSATGVFSIVIPAKVEVAVLIEHADMESLVIPVKLGPGVTWNLGTFHIDSVSHASGNFAKLGLSYPPAGKGYFAFNSQPGAKVALTPTAGVGPIYCDAKDVIDLAATSITAVNGWGVDGGVCDHLGWAGWFDLAPGVYEFKVTAPGLAMFCSHTTPGWPPTSAAATVRGPVLAGYATWLNADCAP
jgi:hypothetical protein